MMRSGTIGPQLFQGDQLRAACCGERFCAGEMAAGGFTRNMSDEIDQRLSPSAGLSLCQPIMPRPWATNFRVSDGLANSRSCCMRRRPSPPKSMT